MVNGLGIESKTYGRVEPSTLDDCLCDRCFVCRCCLFFSCLVSPLVCLSLYLFLHLFVCVIGVLSVAVSLHVSPVVCLPAWCFFCC